MRILNFGSLNVDFVYEVHHIARPGETIASVNLSKFPGGKGLNQSVALARANAQVMHAGMVGQDGNMLIEILAENGVDISALRVIDAPTGNAVIQVGRDGQNCIVLFAGANRQMTKAYVDEIFAHAQADMLLLQNEINLLPYIIDTAYEKGIPIVLNPSPFDEHLLECDLRKIGYFLLNEIEAEQISGKSDPVEAAQSLIARFPKSHVVITLGPEGALYMDADTTCFQPAFPVSAVDTTAAGDTFTGFFLSAVLQQKTPAQALQTAALAASIAIGRKGAASSIPYLSEVRQKAESAGVNLA